MPSHVSGQPLPDWVKWSCCQEMSDDGTPCTGAAQGDYGSCLPHLTPDELDQAIKRAKTDGLDARGMNIRPSLLSHILSLFHRPEQHLPIVPTAHFERTTFTGNVDFRGVTFSDEARFDGATFTGDADFRGVTFTGQARFDGATFTGGAGFTRATFTGNAWFTGATFTGHAWFTETTFTRLARFTGASFTDEARFKTTFTEDAAFTGVGRSEQRLSFQSGRPAKRLQVALRGGNNDHVRPIVDLKEASFAGPAVITANPSGAVQLVSLAQTDTANLTLAGLDLSKCMFLGAINLDRLRIDGELLLDVAPGWWRARRKVLCEEAALRGWPDWGTRASRDNPNPSPQRRDRARRLQAVYRDLRKGREDAKDEPGAADFYYGEMEMRRAAATGWERALLTVYWLVSGYALRASRALVAFAVVVAVFAFLLFLWGFQPASPTRITGVNLGSGAVTYAAASPLPDLGDAFVYSAESATVFFRGTTPEQLSSWGRVFQVCLRLLGPALLALTVLAVRGRVKR